MEGWGAPRHPHPINVAEIFGAGVSSKAQSYLLGETASRNGGSESKGSKPHC